MIKIVDYFQFHNRWRCPVAAQACDGFVQENGRRRDGGVDVRGLCAADHAVAGPWSLIDDAMTMN